jgi:hypothetical protein
MSTPPQFVVIVGHTADTREDLDAASRALADELGRRPGVTFVYVPGITFPGDVDMPPAPPDVLGLSDIARLAGVEPAAVCNWRHRYPDFPPAQETSSGAIFWRSAVLDWLAAHERLPGQRRDPRTVACAVCGARTQRTVEGPGALYLLGRACPRCGHTRRRKGGTSQTRAPRSLLEVATALTQAQVRSGGRARTAAPSA